jgi:hypothetical protein
LNRTDRRENGAAGNKFLKRVSVHKFFDHVLNNTVH